MFNDNRIVEDIKRIPILDVVQALGGLGLNGKLQGDCPTGHDSENHKCFSIDVKDNIWSCFHCNVGRGSSVIDLVMVVENKTFPEALAWFGENFNINGKVHKTVEANPVEKVNLEEIYAKDALYSLIFEKGKELLYTDIGKIALDYLVEARGYAIENLKESDWIYFPSDKEIRVYLLKMQPDAKAQIAKLGLQGAGGDNFRLAFPYRNRDGFITGFVKRATEPKGITIGDSENVRYDSTKGLTKDDLFNLCNCREYKELLIVEGYPDALYLPTLDFKNIVAIGQGALGVKHVDGLKALGIAKVTICLDNDKAGIENTPKAVEKFKDSGIQVYTMNPTLMGAHKDPDEFVKANGIEAFIELYEGAELQTDKSSNPVTEKEAKTKKANAELKAIIGKHDLSTDEGKQSALIEAKAYIDQVTNTNISGKLMATLNDSLGDSKYKKAKYIYTDDMGRMTFSHGKLADELMSEYTFICVDGVLYVYQNGVYNAIGDSFVESECQKRLDWSARNTRINEVISYIKRCVGVKNETLNTHKYLINLENGMYDLTNEKLLTHSTEYLSTTRIPVKYDPNADNSVITAWLASIFVDSDCIQLVCELFGYCMIPDTTMKKAFMLVGPTNTGKSTYSRVLENFVGNENVSKIPLQEISDSRFKRAELFGKLVNIFADLDTKPLKSTSYFKTIVSGDSIDAERKCQNPFFFKPFARLVFSANEIPTSSDKSTAYFNRWNIINFDQVFEGTADKKGLADELSKPENLSALLNCAIFGLKSVLKRQSFTVTEKGKEALADYQKQNDPVGAFLESCCELDVNSRVIRGDLFTAFCQYCAEYEFNACTVKAFYQRIRNLKGVKEDRTSKERLFTGIKLIAG
jgi:P4 family phage/plasmid primase-like protien